MGFGPYKALEALAERCLKVLFALGHQIKGQQKENQSEKSADKGLDLQ